MVKIGVIGAGKLAKMHIRCIQNIPEFTLLGFMEDDDEKASGLEKEFGISRFLEIEDFFNQVDAVSILVPANQHLQLASRAIRASKHVFIEKPLAHTLEDARELVELAYEAKVQIQVGHRERFHPALLHALETNLRPLYIEVNHKRKLDPDKQVDVLMDIMLQDIDIVVSLIRSNIKKIRAFGLSSEDYAPDIVNARIEFDNGSVANLNASRVAEEEENRMQVFQKNSCVTIDYLKQKSTNFPFKKSLVSGHDVSSINDRISGTEAMAHHELSLFATSIISNHPTAVNVQDGYNVLHIAFQISEKIQSKANIR